MKYIKMFNHIWNTEVLKSSFFVKRFYRNGFMFKYYPIGNINIYERGLKK